MNEFEVKIYISSGEIYESIIGANAELEEVEEDFAEKLSFPIMRLSSPGKSILIPIEKIDYIGISEVQTEASSS